MLLLPMLCFPSCCQVVVTDNPAVLHASTIHFGQYGMLVPVLRDPSALAIQAAEWACSQVGGGGVSGSVSGAGRVDAWMDLL